MPVFREAGRRRKCATECAREESPNFARKSAKVCARARDGAHRIMGYAIGSGVTAGTTVATP